MNIDGWVVSLIKGLLRRYVMGFFEDGYRPVGTGGFTSYGTCSSAVADYQSASSGNKAFDEYRKETLKRLQEDRKLFEEFMERLRLSKDKAEFDQFMAERTKPDAAT
jgi:hypothetical protein